ncbi:ATP-binding protein [Actinomadura scrupuli]|uniref:ATP-binding protein n=1 Tax=Actinomadura scrupuli TaxID=559629 RepID=UPI003D990225
MLASRAVVGVARDLVEQTAREWGLPHLSEDLRLVTDELVTNAVAVSPWDGRVKVRIGRYSGGGVMVSVWDQSPKQPESQRVELTLEMLDALPEDHEFGGWGLSIVERLSESCGVTWVEPFGKWVWARFR